LQQLCCNPCNVKVLSQTPSLASRPLVSYADWQQHELAVALLQSMQRQSSEPDVILASRPSAPYAEWQQHELAAALLQSALFQAAEAGDGTSTRRLPKLSNLNAVGGEVLASAGSLR
jgi:hypothetical protein